MIGIIKIAGHEAKKFLQGQLTCNLFDLEENGCQLGAHCNPQGRVISLFLLCLSQGDYLMFLPNNMIGIATQALKKYALFFKTVNITDESDSEKYSLIFEQHKKAFTEIPMIHPETSEMFLPHELNLPAYNAVSFTKGCYTGQEIIARMQYRGKLKNKLCKAQAKSPLPLQPGMEIYNKSTSCGNVVDCKQIGYNVYDLFIIAPENDIKNNEVYLDKAAQIKIDLHT